MNPDRRLRRPPVLLAALCALAVAATTLLASADAEAQSRSRRSDRPRVRETFSSRPELFDDYNWTILRMQRERIASQEEQAREAGRELRRGEVEAQREEDAAAHEEYFNAVIEASRAALRAPRGAYYRPPGFISSAPPGPDARTVTAGGIDYLYERGVFWLSQGTQFIAATAPVGAVVDAPPAGSYPVASPDGVLHYYFGAFFRGANGKYVVTAPPPGVVVSYVPDGYVRDTVNGRTVYRFGAVAFRPVFFHGILSYQVTAP